MFKTFRLRETISLLLLLAHSAQADVVINEVMANGAERRLRWSDAGVPKLGFGAPWYTATYNDNTWQTGNGPFGFGSFTNVTPAPTFGTNMATQMSDLTPTMYLRKVFTVSAADAAKTDQLTLDVQFNDGFICYLNGVEVARRNAGPVNGFVYRDQFAASGTPASLESSTTPYARTQTISLGAANTKLLTGTNVLAVHALNFWEGTTLHNTTTNATVGVDNRNNFLFKGDLKIASATPVTLVANNTSWRFMPGLVEPSGGVYDPALLFLAKQNVVWGRASFDDTAWQSGAAPLGAGTPPAGVTLGTNFTPQIPGSATSVYFRIIFTATEADIADGLPLQLLMDWDDGFVAYINGVEVARDRMGQANAFTPYNAVAASVRNGGSYTTYNLDPPARLLSVGPNVLSVQVHNLSLADADLFMRAQLRTNSAGTNRTMVTPTSTWRYFVGTSEPIQSVDQNVEDNPDAPDSSFDWVELHNNGAEAVSLADWKLSDNPQSVAKWSFPAGVSIPAGGYLLVACDGLNITAPAANGYYHTNFKLSASGETLLLSDAAGVVLQQLSFGAQTVFESYGRDAGGAYAFYTEPTPGAANTGTAYMAQVEPVTFSEPPGFYFSSMPVTLSCATPGATIVYTFNGSEPTLTNGNIGAEAYVTTSSAIRAKAFKAGMMPSRITTGSFLINEPSTRQSVPALCITGDLQRSLYRPYGVMAISGGSFPNFVAPAPTGLNGSWVQTPGTVGSAADLSAYNFPYQNGRFTEKLANMEIINSGGEPGPNVEFGMRISGSPHARPRYRLTIQNRAPTVVPGPNDDPWSVSDFTQKPSFNFYFRNDFGGDPLEWPLFPNYPVTAFHDMRMRAGKNDPTNPFIEDEYMRRLYISTGQQGSRGMINTLFINGQYKGYYNLCEHVREDFLQRHHGGTSSWDVIQVTTVASGDNLSFQEMITYLRNNPQTTLANFQGMKTRLDMVNFIDYLLTNIVGNTGDWPHNNFICSHERVVGGLHRYYLWDAEGAFGDFGGNVMTNMFTAGTTGSIVTTNPSGVGLNEGIRILYTLLRASPEFKLLFADRIQKHFFNGGAFTEARMLSHWEEMKAEFAPVIEPAVIIDRVTPWFNGVGNATRYTTSGMTNTPSRRNVLFNGYYNDTAGGVFVQPQFVAEGLWPATAAPVFSKHGGAVAPGYSLTISNPGGGGTLYYTLDGRDPRVEGGTAQGSVYSSPLTIQYATTVKARVLSAGGEWSPLTEAAFTTGVTEPLLITELMYHPEDNSLINGDEYEFIEIKNPSASAILIGGMSFSSGISYTFPAGTMIAAGQHLVLASISARFSERYPTVTPFGQYGTADTLANSGDTVTLVNAAGATVFSVTYTDDPPWAITPDGDGPSLVPVNANSNPSPNDPAFWRASSLDGGSPGADDPTPPPLGVLVKEVLANPILPALDQVELYNPHAVPVDISHWWLSDSDTTVQKFRIPSGTVIPAGGYLVYHENDLAAAAIPFSFSSNGERARLSSGDITGSLTGYFHSVSFGASNPGESHGSYTNSQGISFFTAMQSQTLGFANSQPRVGPVVISEFMYNPSTGGDEFMELRNISAQPVNLFDPANPANTWRTDGITYSFPTGVTLQPGQMILLTALAPETFRSKYSVPSSIQIFGPYSGVLDNGGERLRLRKPGLPYLDDLGATVVPLIDIDVLTYDDVAPWPTSPDGGGSSLERVNLIGFADDVQNWQASPSPGGTLGHPAVQPLTSWLPHYFTSTQMADPLVGVWSADPDGDGINNFREWAHGLDPRVRNAEPVTQSVQTEGPNRFLHLGVRISRSATGLSVFADITPDLATWNLGGGVQIGTSIDNGDGTETLQFRNPNAIGSFRHFMRIRLEAP